MAQAGSDREAEIGCVPPDSMTTLLLRHAHCAHTICDMQDNESTGSHAEPYVPPSVVLTCLRFVSGDKITLSGREVVVVVGPNNAGKTALLRGIDQKLQDASIESPVLDSLEHTKRGTEEDVVEFVARTAKPLPSSTPANPVFQAYGHNVRMQRVEGIWREDADSLQELSRYFCNNLTTEARLTAANPAASIRLTVDPPTHAIHILQRDDSLEATISAQFRQAFDVDLVIHRNAGREVPLYTGKKPTPEEGEDRVSLSYIRRVEGLVPLADQGDGMRSFASALLHVTVGQESILLLDEPEAFLHPPQARLLGRLLVEKKQAGRQLFVATHSGDVVRGILDAGSASVRVIRLVRSGDRTTATELDSSQIAALWSDSLLRHSNILDGLFHSMVVVCESDSDARFYSALSSSLGNGSPSYPDVMFTHTGGKHRLSVVAHALAQVGVPVHVVADFDLLRDESLVKDLTNAVGADWVALKDDYAAVRNAIEQKKPELDAEEVAKEIRTLLDAVGPGLFPAELGERIRKVLSRSSPWSIAKSQGKSYVPSGTPSVHCEALLAGLASSGVFMVPKGEIEGFVRTIGGHGQRWVNEVLQFDITADPRLEAARRFVRQMLQ